MASHRRRCWYPAFVIYRWRHVMWIVPLLALIGLSVMHWERLRWDHVVAVVQLRPAAACSLSGSSPALPGRASFETISPMVLWKSIRDMGLAAAWQTDDGAVVECLRPLVSCYSIPGTESIEVKVRKSPSVDCLKFCELLLQHAHEEATTDLRGVNMVALSRSKAEERKAWSEFLVVREELRTWDRFNPRTASAPRELIDRYYAKQSQAQEIRLKVISDEADLRALKAPATTIVAPHWPGKPSLRHLKHFGISAAWTFGISMLVAVAMAYLLEALVPRKEKKEEIAPEVLPAHEHS